MGAWIVFEDEAGQDLKSGKGRTWSRRGRTPLVKVTGKGSGRVLMAGMICVRPGRETRLIYRTQTYRGRTGEKKGFRAREFAELITSAHQQLGGAPLILVWDNASTHHAKALREFCDRNGDWLTAVELPPYAPDLNPVAGINPRSVTRIYSERIPCSECRVGIGANYPSTLISYSLKGAREENYVDLLGFMNRRRGGV